MLLAPFGKRVSNTFLLITTKEKNDSPRGTATKYYTIKHIISVAFRLILVLWKYCQYWVC